MLKRNLIVALLFAVCFAHAHTIPQEWQVRYKQLTQAIETLDAKAFKSMFAKDFTYVDEKGMSHKREEFFKEADKLFASGNKVKAKLQLKTYRMHDGIVDVAYDLQTTHFDAKNKAEMMVHEVGVDTWKKVGGKWLFAKSVDSMFKITTPK